MQLELYTSYPEYIRMATRIRVDPSIVGRQIYYKISKHAKYVVKAFCLVWGRRHANLPTRDSSKKIINSGPLLLRPGCARLMHKEGRSPERANEVRITGLSGLSHVSRCVSCTWVNPFFTCAKTLT